jgi:hypothetical protein
MALAVVFVLFFSLTAMVSFFVFCLQPLRTFAYIFLAFAKLAAPAHYDIR